MSTALHNRIMSNEEAVAYLADGGPFSDDLANFERQTPGEMYFSAQAGQKTAEGKTPRLLLHSNPHCLRMTESVAVPGVIADLLFAEQQAMHTTQWRRIGYCTHCATQPV